MIIGQLVDGIVLDHITAGRCMEIYNVLGLGELNCTVAMIKNADSVKMGKKDIVKIGEVIDLDMTVLGYIDPGITVNIIREGKLVKRELGTAPFLGSTLIKHIKRSVSHRSCTERLQVFRLVRRNCIPEL